MKRFLRVLALAGGVFLLLLVTRTRGTAQIGTSDGSCCAVASEDNTYFLPCGNCTVGPHAGVDGGACGYSAEELIADGCESPNTGLQSTFIGQTENCNTGLNGCITGDSCPTTFTNNYWADDPNNCTRLPQGCGTVGVSCNGSSPCCSGYTCLGGTCQSCSPYYGQSCTPSGASQACGTVICNGSCAAECSYSSNCWQGGVEGTCPNGCCVFGASCTYPSHVCQNGTSCSQPCNGNTNGEECPGDTCSGGVWEQCQNTDEGWMYVCSSGTPIIVDVTGEGFPLTDAANGVNFDFFGTGKKVRISWTAPGSNNAWLVLPNASGMVASGKNMFGNITPQPPSKDPNGFLALAVYDLPENGGNGDGIIDARDAIFSKLRLWQDKNHDGISQPNELFTLPQLGVVSISLHYQESSWTDAYGNRFHYKSQIVDVASSHATQWTYDVFLMIAGGS